MVITGTFLGNEMSQTPRALNMWEKVLTEIKDFKRIVDLGTWHGNLSLYFLLFCLGREAEFYTFDNREIWNTTAKKVKELVRFTDYFKHCDIFQHIEEIGQTIQKEGKTILYCDNGKKAREYNTFVPYLKLSDIVAVHDWGREVFPRDIKETNVKYKLKEIFITETEEEGLTRFFQKYE